MATPTLATDAYKFSMAQAGFPLRRETFYFSFRRGGPQYVPFDFAEMIGALAPRTCFISAPLRDANFRWQSVDRIVAAARPIYTLLGAPEALTVAHPDSDHDFPVTMRERAYLLLEGRARSPNAPDRVRGGGRF